MPRKGKGNDKDSLSNGLEQISAPLTGPAVHCSSHTGPLQSKTQPSETSKASNGSLLLQSNVVKHKLVEALEECNIDKERRRC